MSALASHSFESDAHVVYGEGFRPAGRARPEHERSCRRSPGSLPKRTPDRNNGTAPRGGCRCRAPPGEVFDETTRPALVRRMRRSSGGPRCSRRSRTTRRPSWTAT